MTDEEPRDQLGKTALAMWAVQSTCSKLTDAVLELTEAVDTLRGVMKLAAKTHITVPNTSWIQRRDEDVPPVVLEPRLSATWPMNAEGTGYSAEDGLRVVPPCPLPDVWWATLAAELEALHNDYGLTWKSLSVWLGIQKDVWHGLKAPGPDQLKATARTEYGWSRVNWKWTRWMCEGRASRTMKAIASFRAATPPSVFTPPAKPTASNPDSVNPYPDREK